MGNENPSADECDQPDDQQERKPHSAIPRLRIEFLKKRKNSRSGFQFLVPRFSCFRFGAHYFESRVAAAPKADRCAMRRRRDDESTTSGHHFAADRKVELS